MLFPLQLEKSQVSCVVLSGLTWSTVPTFLNHLLTITSASAFFSSKKEKKKKKDLLIIPQDLQKAFFFLSTVESVHLLFFCFFCLECFPIYSTWLVLFVITSSTQMSSPRRDYLIITLKGAQTLSRHLLFFSYKYKIHAFACLATHNESWAS